MNAAIFAELQSIRELHSAPRFQQEWYAVAEVARLLNKRPFTVREWCRLRRINARKTESGRGDVGKEEWRIHHEEIERYKNEGLLPLRK